MSKKESYRLANQQFLENIAKQEGIVRHRTGVMFKVLHKGDGDRTPNIRSVVTVHYRGTLANGREFDNSWKRGTPEALRVSDVIDGWQIALQQMHTGDRWMVYIPSDYGYGNRTTGPIPACSALVFEVELISIM